ncbi:extracellular solute-binding protein [Cohnella sp. 56]|uniref:extracellular solute-binding protein n=1 Tax=Cohnella sp. 56 TaxID=3113722 RepID=UPI0030E9F0B5
MKNTAATCIVLTGMLLLPGCALWSSNEELTKSAIGNARQISIYSFDRQDYDSHPDRVLAEIERRTDTRLQLHSGYWDDTQFDVMMASGEYPDVITIVDSEKTGRFNKWVREGKLIPFTNELLAGLPHLQKLFADPVYQDLKIDGQFYGLPLKDEFPQNSPGQYIIALRKDWLEQLHLKVPETLEQFKQVLIAFKTQDPDRNGLDDTYGLISNGLYSIVRNLVGAWGIPSDARSTGFLKVGDRYEYWAIQPQVKEALRYVRDLYQSKLIQPDTLSANTNVQVRPKFIEGKVGVLFDNMNFDELIKKQEQLKRTSPQAEMMEISALAGPDGDRGYSAGSGFWGYTVITNQAKNPRAAAELFDFLLSEEGQALTTYGIPDTHFTQQNGSIALNLEERKKDIGFGQQPGVQHELNWGIVSWTPLTAASYLQFRDLTRPGFSDIVKENLERVNRYLIAPASYNIATPKWISFKSNSDELYQDYFNRIVMGELDVDRGFDTFVKKWEESGGQDAMREMSDAIKQSKAAAG